jgi:hypothetical protein
MAHAQKSDFVFRRNGRVHLNRQGRQFSRLLAAEVCASAVVMMETPSCAVVRRVLASFPFISPPVLHRVPSRFNWTVHRFKVVQNLSGLAEPTRRAWRSPTMAHIWGNVRKQEWYILGQLHFSKLWDFKGSVIGGVGVAGWVLPRAAKDWLCPGICASKGNVYLILIVVIGSS